MKCLIFIIYVITGIFNSSIDINAQPVTWQRVFGLDSNVQGTRVIQTLDGGYLIVGKWSPESLYPNQTRIIRLDQYGNLICMRNYTVETSNSVIQDSDTTFILVGFGSFGGGLFKINYNGDSIVYKEYGGVSISRFYSITKYYDGGFVIAGEGSDGMNSFGYVVRLNNNLNVIWENTYNDSNYKNFSMGEEFVVDSNNNLAFPCIGYSVMTGLGDGGLVKLDQNGNLYSKQFYITTIRDGFGFIKRIGDNYAMSGLAFASLDKNSILKIYYALTDTNGNLLTSRYYDEENAYYRILVKTASDNLAFGGFDENNSQTKMGIRKIDHMGNIIWTRKIINSLHVSAPSATISTSDQGYLLTGIYENPISHMFSLYVVKCDSSAYTKPVSITNQHLTVPDKFVLHNPYPNPFNGNVKIKYEIIQKNIYSMCIYDITGKAVSTVFSEVKNPGLYQKNLGDYFKTLPSSIYFISLIHNNDISTKKIFYVK